MVIPIRVLWYSQYGISATQNRRLRTFSQWMREMAFLATTRTEADAAEKDAATQKRAIGSSR